MPRAERFRPLVLGGTAIVVLAATSLLFAGDPVIYNHSPSLPAGFYLRTSSEPTRERLIRFAMPPAASAYARDRGDDVSDVTFLKPIAAADGDRVCRDGADVSVNGAIVAVARGLDSQGRPLPAWSGCRILGPSEVLVLATRVPNSFDSRYYGPVPASRILGVYRPLWTFSP